MGLSTNVGSSLLGSVVASASTVVSGSKYFALVISVTISEVCAGVLASVTLKVVSLLVGSASDSGEEDDKGGKGCVETGGSVV